MEKQTYHILALNEPRLFNFIFFTTGYNLISRDKIPGGLPYKNDGVLVGHFEKNPLKIPESRLVGVAQINFHP